MKKLTFDAGLEEYRLFGGVLRFNPADPNVYIRFQEAVEKFQILEQAMAHDLQTRAPLQVMAETDRAIKDTLGWVFGPGNDFDKLLGGINLLATASDGRSVVQHLFEALEPVLLEGAKKFARQQAGAVAQ